LSLTVQRSSERASRWGTRPSTRAHTSRAH